MKIGNYHLTYCANVHQGESWEEAFQQLKGYLPSVKQKVAPNESFGVGLYLSDRASREIGMGSQLGDFKKWLDDEGLYVFTMNGFPYGGFHGDVVKENVYKPDWTSRERVEYTKRLFNILAALLPEGIDGGISTLPVSYKYWFESNAERNRAMDIAFAHLIEIAVFLNDLSIKTSRHFHLDIEPEPDCILENSVEVIDFFKRLKNFDTRNSSLVAKHIMLCFDICHFSVEYEEPDLALQKLIANGIKIGKIQISSALKAIFPKPGKTDDFIRFNESRYLHQTVKKSVNGELKRFRDLSQAIGDLTESQEWRTHFHVPLFIKSYDALQSTQDDVVKVINLLKENHITNHLETETYTWEVLPADLKMELTTSIIREIEWVKNSFSE